MRTLGERIRTLRKQRKLTLESCAGEQMTKGMLSLIENNKANPSMENLNYLAKRLEVEVSELMEEVSGSELQALLDKAEQVVKSEEKKNYEKTLEMIEPLLPKLLSGYTAGRLLEIYSKFSYLIGRSNWQPIAERASAIYEELNIVPRRAAVGIFWAMVLFTEHRYEEALTRLLEEKVKVESRSGYIDSLTRLDLYTYEVIFRFAVNDTVEATRLMNEAISYSKDKKIFYQVEQLYRLAAYRAIIDEDDEKLDYYERKLLQYGEFAEDDHAFWFTKLVRIHQLNSFHHDHETALKKLSELTGPMPEHEFFTNFFVLERGKALYGAGKFQEALHMLQQVVISEQVHHPYDLSMYYEKDAYAALCAEQLGELAYARELAETADSNMAQMPDTPYTQFVRETAKRFAAQ